MSEQITIQLNSDAFNVLTKRSRVAGKSAADFAKDALEGILLGETVTRGSQRGAVRKWFGTIDSGDSNSADNDRIDADLAREYGGELAE